MAAYPSLPTAYLHPPTTSRADSASSVEPLTPPSATSAATTRSPVTPGSGAEVERDELDADQQGQEPGIVCKWKDCSYSAPGPEELYTHLCESHIGRKSTNNLCLTCGWEGCGVKCVKRDHITSHLRVHTPLKPHPCSVCGKTFKRPQDLKKHERIHTQEHHQLHKLSKASTSTDPEFNSRYPTRDDHLAAPNRSPQYSLSPGSSPHHPTSPFDNAHLLGLPGTHTSSTSPVALAALHKKQHEELVAHQQRELFALQQLAYQQQQSSAYAAQLANEALGAKGMKRGNEDAFDSFVEDMKKRKMEPVYDIDMISRLNALIPPGLTQSIPPLPSLPTGGYPNQMSAFSYPSLPNIHLQTPSGVPPMPIPDIRTEADLALFNQFMVSLGREATALPMESSLSSNTSTSASRNSLSPLSENSPIEDLFNPSELASLGLAGMPGIPTTNSSPSIAASMPPGGSGVSLGSLYPSLDGLDNGRPRAASVSESHEPMRRPIAGLPRTGSTSGPAARPQAYGNGYGQYPPLPNDWAPQPSEQNYASFDSLGRSRPSVPSATLASRDFYKRTYRHIAPLGAAPKARESAERTGADEEDEEEDSDSADEQPRIPVHALLADGDPSLKLPAIGSIGNGDGKSTILPPLRLAAAPVGSGRRTVSPARHPPVKRHTDEQLIHGVKRLELDDRRRGESPATSVDGTVSSASSRPSTATPRSQPGARDQTADVRRRHAALIRAWLVAVNLEFKRQQLASKEKSEWASNSPSGRLGVAEIAA